MKTKAEQLVKKLTRRVRNRQSAQRSRSKAAIARSWNHVKPE